jgi:hypothetical protein
MTQRNKRRIARVLTFFTLLAIRKLGVHICLWWYMYSMYQVCTKHCNGVHISTLPFSFLTSEILKYPPSLAIPLK